MLTAVQYTVSGAVSGSEDGKALAGVLVVFLDANGAVAAEATTGVDGSYSGSGSQFLMYEGPAASATATSDGDGTFNIEVFSDEGYEWVVNDSDSVQTRFSWDPNPRIVMSVRTEHSSTPWTIDFDTPAVSK